MDPLWLVAVGTLIVAVAVTALVGRRLRRDTTALEGDTAELAGLRADAVALGAEVRALRDRLAGAESRRTDQ